MLEAKLRGRHVTENRQSSQDGEKGFLCDLHAVTFSATRVSEPHAAPWTLSSNLPHIAGFPGFTIAELPTYARQPS